MLSLQPPAEPSPAAEGAKGAFNAGETIIEHVSNTGVDHPVIHLPRVFGIDMSVTKHVLMLWIISAILFVGITWLVRRFIKRVHESPEYIPILPDGFVAEARKFYYDCAQAPDAPSMASLKAVVPVSQIVFGTDWPYLTTEEHVTGLEKSGVFSAQELEAIGRGNALKLMPTLKPV